MGRDYSTVPCVIHPECILIGMNERLNTPRALIDWGAREFERAGLVFQHGTDTAADEAAWIVMHLLDIGYDQPDAILDTELEQSEQARVLGILRERAETRKPAAYLLNQAWFSGLPFYVDERVLVPRSPIAELIETRFSPWIGAGEVRRVLDLCTGSGCIGIACAHAFPGAHVDLADLSRDALAVARENIRRHQLQGRVEAVVSNVFSALSGLRYDIIVSNPPYVPAAEYRQLPDEFQHEPGMGLEAGSDGLDIVVQILLHAGSHLSEGGILVVEVGNSADHLVEVFPEVPFLWLEFEYGGEGVFMLDVDQLATHQQVFENISKQRAG